jgi:NADPH:quinone reductase
MRAVVMTAPGGPDVLRLVEMPEPELSGDHDVRVRLRAAGVNPVDYKIRANGLIRGAPPAVLGWDGAGTGEAAGHFDAGDLRVVAGRHVPAGGGGRCTPRT